MMLSSSNKLQNIYSLIKSRFPNVDIHSLNPELSLSQNLQKIVMQVEIPSSKFQINYSINSMKEAVDKQELKIQTSLVNDENVDVNNAGRRNGIKIGYDHHSAVEDSNMDEQFEDDCLGLKRNLGTSFQYQHEQNPQIIQQIWQFDYVQVNNQSDWFQR